MSPGMLHRPSASASAASPELQLHNDEMLRWRLLHERARNLLMASQVSGLSVSMQSFTHSSTEVVYSGRCASR